MPAAITPADGGAAKRYVVGSYASQLAPGDVGALDPGGARRGCAERLWVPAAGAAAWARVLGG